MNDSCLKMSLIGIPWDFMYKISTFKFSKPRLSPSCICWWNLLAIFHLFSSFLSWYVNTHAHIYTQSHIFTYAQVYTCPHTCTHMYICTSTCASTHTCTRTCMLTCTCARMLCAHIHTQPKTMSPATRYWVTGLLSLPHSISLFISQIRTKPLGSSGETVRKSTSGGLQPRSPRTKPSYKSSTSSLNNHHSPWKIQLFFQLKADE